MDPGYAAITDGAKATACAWTSCTLSYICGRVLPLGVVFRLSMRHVHGWDHPQTNDPLKAGWVNASPPEGVLAGCERLARSPELDSETFPWQHIVEIRLSGRALQPGETLRIHFGDRSRGGPGARASAFSVREPLFRLEVDPDGQGEFVPVPGDFQVEVQAARALNVVCVAPPDAMVGRPFRVCLRLEDPFGNVSPATHPPISLSGHGLEGELSEIAFVNGLAYAVVLCEQAGICRITAYRDHVPVALSGPVLVRGREYAGDRFYFGDLHGHTAASDGYGQPHEHYSYARDVSGLDFCALTEHGFLLSDQAWQSLARTAEAFNEDGRFATLCGYEWDGQSVAGGDHCVYFRDAAGPLWRTSTLYSPRNPRMVGGAKVDRLEELLQHLGELGRGGRAMVVPHVGGRCAQPRVHAPELIRLLEVYSEFGRHEPWAEQYLSREYRVGFVASGDGHFCRPGNGYMKPTDLRKHGMALTVVQAPRLTRTNIFDALYARRCYATTGARILLDVRVNGAPMGGEWRGAGGVELRAVVHGTAPLRSVEVFRGNAVVHLLETDGMDANLVWSDPVPVPGDWRGYFLRVIQSDGHMAITSPVWCLVVKSTDVVHSRSDSAHGGSSV